MTSVAWCQFGFDFCGSAEGNIQLHLVHDFLALLVRVHSSRRLLCRRRAMVQRAIVVCLAVGFHSGDAVDKPVAYEMRVWKDPGCSGPPHSTFRYPLESCRKETCNRSPCYAFDHQINDTHLHRGAGYADCWPNGDGREQIAGDCLPAGGSGSMGYFWAYSKDLVV